MADENGNDISQIGIPVTGHIALAPEGTAIPSSAGGASDSLVLDPAFRKIGLVKQDGGPQLAFAADGDPIEFWQDGYEEPSGLANVTLAFTAAEIGNDWVRELESGEAPDLNGSIDVDGGGHSTRYVAFTEEIFKNGAIRRRAMGWVTVQSVTEDKNTRGEVLGKAFVLKINRSSVTSGKHWRDWWLPADISS